MPGDVTGAANGWGLTRVGRSHVDLTGASSTVVAGLLTEPLAADPANRACRAGHSIYVQAASERVFIERRGVALRSTKVAVSLRRDEPCNTPLASIWPVDSHDGFTQNGLHRVLQTKDQRLVSTERDGYFGEARGGSSVAGESCPARKACRNLRSNRNPRSLACYVREY
jgi:hypothetical protein